jgi:hypothetical protein
MRRAQVAATMIFTAIIILVIELLAAHEEAF